MISILRMAHAIHPVGSLAQSVEQLAFNQLVEGSNPSRPTILLLKASYLLRTVLEFLK